MDTDLKYSVIIPYYKSIDLLMRAIDSIPKRDDIEVLVVDNGLSSLPIDTFSDRTGIHLLYSIHGKGAGAARNKALDVAKGKWLLFLDADDYFLPDAFVIFDKHCYSSAEIVFFGIDSYDNQTQQRANRHIEFNQLINQYLTSNNETVLRYQWSSPWGKLLSRQLIEREHIRFDEVPAANDVMFSLISGYYSSSIEAYPDIAYCATIQAGSLTQTNSKQNLISRIDVSIRYNKFLKSHQLKKHRKSIMYLIYLAYLEHGSCFAFKLLFHSIYCGNNPFIGITRWHSTIKHIKQQ